MHPGSISSNTDIRYHGYKIETEKIDSEIDESEIRTMTVVARLWISSLRLLFIRMTRSRSRCRQIRRYIQAGRRCTRMIRCIVILILIAIDLVAVAVVLLLLLLLRVVVAGAVRIVGV